MSPGADRFERIRPARPKPRLAPPTARDVEAMREALDLARRAAAIGETPVGALVYDTASGRELGRGFNRRETDHDPVAHAEILAIREAAQAIRSWRLNGCTLVVTLEPCPMCAGACVNARVGRVVFGAADPKAGAARTLYEILDDPRLNHRCAVIPDVLAGESAALLRDFFRGLRSR